MKSKLKFDNKDIERELEIGLTHKLISDLLKVSIEEHRVGNYASSMGAIKQAVIELESLV